MTSRALILLAALIMGSSADAQNCPTHFPSNDQCSDHAFQNQICNMGQFDPSTLDPTNKKAYNTPTCAAGSVSAGYTTLLTNAYHLAPSKVKAALCQLHRIFVTTDASYSRPRPPIGLWEAPGRGGGHVWIAIPDYILDYVLNVIKTAPSLDHAENGILGELFHRPTPPPLPLPTSTNPYLPWPPTPPPPVRSLPTFTTASTPPEAGILAVLAHELGHIMLADTNADGANQANNPNRRPCNAPTASSCFSAYFLAGWNAAAFQQRRWIEFGIPNPSIQYQLHPGFTDIAADIALNTPAGDAQATMHTYQAIYSVPTFVSVFASLSPEEDYAETYKYKTLAAAAQGAPLNLRISLPNFTPPSVDVLPPSGALQNKLTCVPPVN